AVHRANRIGFCDRFERERGRRTSRARGAGGSRSAERREVNLSVPINTISASRTIRWSRTIRRPPPVQRGVNDLATRYGVPRTHGVPDDVVLVRLVGGDRTGELKGTEGNARPGLGKTVSGKAVL